MNPMRVVFDVRPLIHDRYPSGVPVYAAELIRHLAGAVDLQLAGDTPSGPGELPGNYVFLPHHKAWQQLHLPGLLYRLRPALFHSTHFTLPLLAPVPMVVSVHDLSFLQAESYLRTWTPWSIRRAAHIITPTEYVRREVAEVFRINPERITVTPYGVGAPFTTEMAPGEVAPYPWPYILSVSTLEPRKNLLRLVRAYALLLDDDADLPHHLVLVGRPTAEAARLKRLADSLGVDGRLHLTGYLTREEVARLYRHAALLAYPSLYEGFGLPALEAMASGCPVVAGDNSGMAEVVADAGILVEASDENAIARGLRTVLRADRARQRQVGIERAARFSWENTARRTVEVYQRVTRALHA